MYSRSVAGTVCSFEASGGLINGSLVMQDRETDTYWELMKSEGIAGPLRGKHLTKLPALKTQWSDWEKSHPKTLVLSVNGREDISRNPYANYFKSSKGFRGLRAADERLATKAPLLALTHEGLHLAIPHAHVTGGGVLALPDKGGSLFAHRPAGASVFRSTRAYFVRGKVERREGTWVHVPSGARFDTEREEWSPGKGPAPRPLNGMDTFWVTWSLAHPKTLVLTPEGPQAAPEASPKGSPEEGPRPATRPAGKGPRWF